MLGGIQGGRGEGEGEGEGEAGAGVAAEETAEEEKLTIGKKSMMG
jgi:hypothetical protein